MQEQSQTAPRRGRPLKYRPPELLSIDPHAPNTTLTSPQPDASNDSVQIHAQPSDATLPEQTEPEPTPEIDAKVESKLEENKAEESAISQPMADCTEPKPETGLEAKVTEAKVDGAAAEPKLEPMASESKIMSLSDLKPDDSKASTPKAGVI